MKQLLIAIAGISLLSTGFADCGFSTPAVVCQTFKVPSQTPPTGYYVKISLNKTKLPILCMAKGSTMGLSQSYVKKYIKSGQLVLGSNKIVTTQCKDANCTDTVATFTYNFKLSRSGSTYQADTPTATDKLTASDTTCTTTTIKHVDLSVSK